MFCYQQKKQYFFGEYFVAHEILNINLFCAVKNRSSRAPNLNQVTHTAPSAAGLINYYFIQSLNYLSPNQLLIISRRDDEQYV